MTNEKNNNGQTIEQILNEMGIFESNTSKKIVYKHWSTFCQCLQDYNGEDWNRAKHKMRARVCVDHRYLLDYLNSFMEFGYVELQNGKIVWKGISDGNNGKPISEETTAYLKDTNFYLTNRSSPKELEWIECNKNLILKIIGLIIAIVSVYIRQITPRLP